MFQESFWANLYRFNNKKSTKVFQIFYDVRKVLSDFHKMCDTVMKTYYNKQKPSIFKYQKYNFFFNDAFLKDLLSKFDNEQNAPISSLKETVNRTLEKQGEFKKRYVRVNQIHFINKTYVNRVKKYQTYGCNKSQEENPVI